MKLECYLEISQGRGLDLWLCVCEMCRGMERKAWGQLVGNAFSLKGVIENSKRERAEEGSLEKITQITQIWWFNLILLSPNAILLGPHVELLS